MSLAGLWVTRFGTRSPELTGHRLGWGKGQGWTASATGNLGQGKPRDQLGPIPGREGMVLQRAPCFLSIFSLYFPST